MTVREIAALFEQLELHLIGSLKRNLLRHKRQERDEGGVGGVPEHWEAWQSAKLRDLRRFRRENQDILGAVAPVIEAETAALLQEQYAEGGADGFFGTSDEKLRGLIREMQRGEVRVERAALRYMDDVYRKTILRTATAMTAGGMTLQQAVDEATKDFLAQGINCVRYANGRQVNIASYAEMALRTCGTRAMLLGEAQQRQRLGIDTVLVSRYGACSDTCLPWQGRVYIDDVFQPYYGPRGGSFGVSRNGRQYMLLSVAIRGGLFHPNCRHTITTWIEGVSTMPDPMDPAKIERVNKLEQKQRQLERQVRQAKREAAGLADPEAVKAAKAEVRRRQAVLREFVKEHGDVLRRDYWRERGPVDGEKAPVVSTVSSGGKVGPSPIQLDSIKDPTWRPNEGVDSWPDERAESLSAAEKSLIGRKTEKSVIYDPGGTVVFEKAGDRGSVRFTQEETQRMKGGVLTHNHPNASCFSPEDIRMLFDAKLTEIRAVTRDGVYRLQRPVKWPGRKYSLEKIEQIYYDIDKEVSTPLYAKAFAGQISFAEAEMLGQIEVIREFGKRHGLAFEFVTWEDQRRWSGGSTHRSDP